ncbi:MAG TPA: YHS domain-containing protein [Chitinophagales bacterium]|nr:YHS domain-containing protein [Chitinophagales bacterium]
MKNLITTFSISAILLSGCGSGSQKKMGGGTSIDVSPDKLSVKLDPVCQMSMDQHPIADTMTYQGKLYGFCSPGCKEAFIAEPEKFLPELPE